MIHQLTSAPAHRLAKLIASLVHNELAALVARHRLTGLDMTMRGAFGPPASALSLMMGGEDRAGE
jgi:hypothetical protein